MIYNFRHHALCKMQAGQSQGKQAQAGQPLVSGRFPSRYHCTIGPSLALETARSTQGRTWGVGISLVAFLLTQWLLPGALLLQEANAAEARVAKATRSGVDERIALGEQRSAKARRTLLAQAQSREEAQEKRIQESEPAGCGPDGDCEVSVKALDLSKPPTEKALRMAGGMGGALSPVGSADWKVWAERFDRELKSKGVPEGIMARSDGDSYAAKLVKARQEKLERLNKINTSFGRAMQNWNQHRYALAAQMLRQHIEEFKDSPWNGEAALHLGCDAKYNGRFTEAAQIYNEILTTTEGKPGSDSYDIHQKAKLRWADLDISLGKLNDARDKLTDLIKTDSDWRRRTWAIHWLKNMSLYRKNFRDLRACGTRALGTLLADLGHDKAASKISRLQPTNSDGFSLGELRRVAAREGIEMRGFRAKPEQLAALPLPLLIHYDFDKIAAPNLTLEKTDNHSLDNHSPDTLSKPSPPAAPQNQARTAALRQLGQVLGVGSPSRENAVQDGDKAANKPLYQITNRAGHFLIVRAIQADKRIAKIYDPQEGRHYTLSFEALGREWSGTGLLAVSGNVRAKQAANVLATMPSNLREKSQDIASGSTISGARESSQLGRRIAFLSDAEMDKVIGGCCGVARPPSGMGPDTPRAEPDCGTPSWSINPVNLNMYLSDTPIWYQSSIGPDVNLTISYNSQETTNQNSVFGNKWSFNFGSYLVEDTQAGGGVITVFMPSSAQENFLPDGRGGYTSQTGSLSRLVKINATRYELIEQSGEKYIYDIPSGTTSLQQFLVEMRDPWGNSLTFGYNSQVKLTTITDELGRVTTLNYTNGRVTSVVDPFERRASFSYDASGNLIEVIDIEGNAFQYTYDSDVFITQLNTVQGAWRFKSELPGREFQQLGGDQPYYITVSDPMGNATKWGYDARPAYHDVYVIDPNGNRTDFAAGSLVGGKGRVTQTRFYQGSVSDTPYLVASETSNYDPVSGLLTSTTDTAGQTTRFSYNKQGQITALTDGLGRTTKLLYAANGIDVVGLVNAAGQRMSTVQFNAFHQPTQAVDANSNPATMTYTTWGALESITDPDNSTVSYNYNTTIGSPDRGRVMSIDRDNITLVTYTYDKLGRVKTETGTDNKTVVYNYDELDNVTRVTYPDGTFSETAMVCCGLPGAVTHRNGSQTFYDYDALKRLRRVQDAQGNSVLVDYDGKGNLRALTDSKKSRTEWQYDALDRPVKKVYADGSFESVAYDALNRSIAQRDAQGRLTRSFYDKVGNLARVDYPDAPDVTYLYDVLNRPIEMRDGIGKTTFAFDNLNRLTASDGPWPTDNQTYTYDSTSRRQTMTLQNALATDGKDDVTYTFDGLDRLSTLAGEGGSFGLLYQGNTDLPQRLNRPNGTYTTWNFNDALNRLQNVVSRVSSTSALISQYSYTYETNNSYGDYRKRSVVTSQTQLVTGTQQKRVDYSYDNVNQLTDEVLTIVGQPQPSIARHFDYDAMGNRSSSTYETFGTGANLTQTSYTGNALNQTVGASSTHSNGSPSISGTTVHDVHGNQVQQLSTQSGQTTLNQENSFDSLGRLTRVVRYDSVTGNPTTKSEFFYDGLSRKRIARESVWNNNSNQWNVQGDTRYLYDGLDVIQERTGLNVVKSTYTRAGNIGGLLAKTDWTGSNLAGVKTNYYYHYDGQGNVVQMTDENQVTVAKYAYDAFGNSLEASGTYAGNNRYRYSTKEYHAQSGYYDFGLRFYSTGYGKWITRDPIAESGGLNLYAFCANNPLSNVDEYGADVASAAARFAQGVWDGLLGGGMTFVTAAVTAGAVSFLMGSCAPAIPIITAIVCAIGGAIGVYALVQQLQEIMNDPTLCPDEKWYQVGVMVGDFLAGLAGGGAGMKFGPKNTGCFVAGTLVTMADGTRKRIEDVKEGDKVKTRNEASGKDEIGTVKQTFVRHVDKTYLLTLSTGEQIETTDEHPFYVPNSGFVQAKQLAVGTSIVTRAGPSVQVKSIQVKKQPAVVYNFEVEAWYSYFVGNAALWAHNQNYNPRIQKAGKEIRDGADEVHVRTPDEAKELFFREFRSGDGTPSYTDTGGWDLPSRKQWGSKEGTFHWDDAFGENSKVHPGAKVLQNHRDDGKLHNYWPHLQIHTFDGRTIRILVGPRPSGVK